MADDSRKRKSPAEDGGACSSKGKEDDPFFQRLDASKKARQSLVNLLKFPASRLDVFITGGPFPVLSQYEKEKLTLETFAILKAQQTMEADFGEYRLTACPYMPIGLEHIMCLVPAKDIPAYVAISRLWVQLRQAVTTGNEEEAVQARDQLKYYLEDPMALPMERQAAIDHQTDGVDKFLVPEALEHLLGDSVDYFVKAHADEQLKSRVGFTLLSLRDNIALLLNMLSSLPTIAIQSSGDATLVLLEAANTLLIIDDSNRDALRAAEQLYDLTSCLLAGNHDQARVSFLRLQNYRTLFHLEHVMASQADM